METISVDLVNPFVSGAFSVLNSVLGTPPERGQLCAELSGSTNYPVNVVIGVTGSAQGHIIFGMSMATAINIASTMIGKKIKIFDILPESAICELANMICGTALGFHAEHGRVCDITPPTMIRGVKVRISSQDIPTIIMPLLLPQGLLSLCIALRCTSTAKCL